MVLECSPDNPSIHLLTADKSEVVSGLFRPMIAIRGSNWWSQQQTNTTTVTNVILRILSKERKRTNTATHAYKFLYSSTLNRIAKSCSSPLSSWSWGGGQGQVREDN